MTIRGVSDVPGTSPSAVLQRLTLEINQLEAQAQTDMKHALEYKLEIGRRLLAARALFRKEPGWRGRNEWEQWGEREFGWVRQHLNDHVKLFRNDVRVRHFDPGTSLRAALAILKGPKKPKDQVEKPSVWILTGRVPCRKEDKVPKVPEVKAALIAELIPACRDWRVRRG